MGNWAFIVFQNILYNTFIYTYLLLVTFGCSATPLFVVHAVQAVVEFRSYREIDNITQIKVQFTLKLRTEQEEIHPMLSGIGRIALKRRIARHLKLFNASVPNL